MYICTHTQYLPHIMLVNTAVDIIGPEDTSKCYNNAKSNSNSELAKNPIANPLARPE